jgi:serine/threonine protein phosphatase PrpC
VYRLVLLDSISDAGSPNKANEDLIVASTDFCAVLDGATGLGEQLVSSASSDAVWFVERIAQHLLSNVRMSIPFVEQLALALNAVIDEYRQFAGNHDRPGYEQPSAGLAAVAIEKDGIYAYRFGDCVVYHSHTDVKERVFPKSPLESLDEQAIIALGRELRALKSPDQARQAIMPILRAHRERMNTPEGYGVLSPSKRCLSFLERKKIVGSSRSKIILTTDGFSAIEAYGGYVPEDIFRLLEAEGLDSMLNKIRQIEYSDPGLTSFPRLKPHDDATAAVLQVVD